MRHFEFVCGVVLAGLAWAASVCVMDWKQSAVEAAHAKGWEKGFKEAGELRNKEAIYYCRRGMFLLKGESVITDVEFRAYQDICEVDGVPQ